MLACAGAGLIGLLVVPGIAQASSTTADQRALTGYHTYLMALTADAHVSAGRDNAVVTAVELDCPDALADLTQLSAAQLKQSALSDFGDEVDAALAMAYLSPSRPALGAFATSLTGLKWSSASETTTTQHLITTERALLRVPPADLCADAMTLDATPLSEPTTTASFLKHYRVASRNESLALKAFQMLLGRYETTGEAELVAGINTLVTQFTSQSSATESADASAILSDLGVSQS